MARKAKTASSKTLAAKLLIVLGLLTMVTALVAVDDSFVRGLGLGLGFGCVLVGVIAYSAKLR